MWAAESQDRAVFRIALTEDAQREAKDCHPRGKPWFQKNKEKIDTRWLEELTAFQAEADAVLAQPTDQHKK